MPFSLYTSLNSHFSCLIVEHVAHSSNLNELLITYSSLRDSGRLWRPVGLSSAFRPVVYCWSNQLGTWMRQNWFPGGLHSSDVHQELDFHLPAFLRSLTGKGVQTAQTENYPVKTLAQKSTEQTEVMLNATQTFSPVLTCVANWIHGCFFFF